VSVLLGRGDGTFLPAVSYSVGSGPKSVAVGDFNRDGYLDIATANFGDNTVSVLLGRGDGTFLPAVSYPVGGGPYSVAVADINGDGNPDIVTANLGDKTVSVLLGRGDGTFLPAGSYPVGSIPDSVAVADINGDGNPDIVTANYEAPAISVLLGKGNGQFQTATPDTGIARRNVPFLQDLTGDGLPDALVLNSSGTLLFRQGLPGAPDSFAPFVPINPGHPARDATVFRTARGWAMAAVDDAGNTVSLYSWDAVTRSFQRTVAFATGNLPVRIAAADLTGQVVQGQPLDDLVVTNDFDHSVTLAFQQLDGTFTTLTRTVGVGPSDIACADLGGPDGADLVVSDQVSGDVSVLFNDPGHSFSRQSRYRAGSGLFDIALDPSTGEPTVLSQLQTVGLAAGAFTGSGSDDLVVLNQGARSFTLLPNQGQGRFTDPQTGNTYDFPTSVQSSQAARLTLPGDTLPSVAILMEDLSQIWIYRNNGHGTFAPPLKIDAGNDPSGFSVATVDGKLALLVGNAYGDILTLLYDGQGGFAPDRADLQHAPLAVGTTSTGQQFAVVANEKQDQVSLYYRLPGSDQFGSPIPISGTTQLPLLAPGAVQTFYVKGDPNPYLVVANSLSNNVLVYHHDPLAGQFQLLASYAAGDNPVSVTVADVNGDGVPDLLVANPGSNDVSVLIGSTATGVWTATPYQRLNSGGLGPMGVAVRASGGPNGPNLEVTNSDGGVFLLPGIGSGGTGSGFFQDTPQPVADLGQPLVQSVPDPTTGQVFLVGSNGSAGVLTGGNFTPIVTAQPGPINAVGPLPDGDLVAALQGGTVEMLHLNPATGLYDVAGTLTPLNGLPLDPSELAVLPTDTGFEVLVTNEGDNQLFVFVPEQAPAPEGVTPPGPPENEGPVVIGLPEAPPAVPAAQPTPSAEAPLLLVVALVTPADEAESAQAGAGAGAEGSGLGTTDRNADRAPEAAVEVGGADEAALAKVDDESIWADDDAGPGTDDHLPELDLYRKLQDRDLDAPVSLSDLRQLEDWLTRVLARLGQEETEGLTTDADFGPAAQPGPDLGPLLTGNATPALDALFGAQPWLADGSWPGTGGQESWVAGLAGETLGLTAPPPSSRSLREVLGMVASALGTESAPATQVQGVGAGSALPEEAGPPALLSTGLSAGGEVEAAPPSLPPGAGTPDRPPGDASAPLPAVEQAGTGGLPWELALVLAGWGHACLRDQAVPVRDRKPSPAVPGRIPRARRLARGFSAVAPRGSDPP
jgi:hypothetical protein